MAAFACALLVACESHTAQIQNSAVAVRDHAGAAIVNQDEIDRVVAGGGSASDVRPLTDDTRGRMGLVDSLSQGIVRHSQSVMDTTPGWVRGLVMLGWVLLIGGVAFLMVYLGVGRIVRPLMNRVGLWLTPSMKEQAKMDAEVLERGDVSAEFSRATTIRKADPTYRVALNRATTTLRSKSRDT